MRPLARAASRRLTRWTLKTASARETSSGRTARASRVALSSSGTSTTKRSAGGTGRLTAATAGAVGARHGQPAEDGRGDVVGVALRAGREGHEPLAVDGHRRAAHWPPTSPPTHAAALEPEAPAQRDPVHTVNARPRGTDGPRPRRPSARRARRRCRRRCRAGPPPRLRSSTTTRVGLLDGDLVVERERQAERIEPRPEVRRGRGNPDTDAHGGEHTRFRRGRPERGRKTAGPTSERVRYAQRCPMPRTPLEPQFPVEHLSILDSDGNLDAALEPELSPDELKRLYRAMLLGRRLDERMVRLQRQGRIGTFAPIKGQEASQIGSVCDAHADGLDGAVVPRDGGHALARLADREDAALLRRATSKGGQPAPDQHDLPIAHPRRHPAPARRRARLRRPVPRRRRGRHGVLRRRRHLGGRLPRGAELRRRLARAGRLRGARTTSGRSRCRSRSRPTRARSPRRRSPTASPASRWTATTCSPSTRPPARRSSARARATARR